MHLKHNSSHYFAFGLSDWLKIFFLSIKLVPENQTLNCKAIFHYFALSPILILIFASRFNLLALLLVFILRFHEIEDSLLFLSSITAYETFVEAIFESVPQIIIQILNNKEATKGEDSS